MPMRRLLSWLLLALLLPLSNGAEELADKIALPPTAQKSMAWIGLHVAKLDPAMRAHALEVPLGTGFVVTVVDREGPSMEAGVKPYDVWWKLDDQLLVNEAQLGALLRLHQPGDQVALTLVRSGKLLTIELNLAPLSDRKAEVAVSPMEIPLAPIGVKAMPRQIIYPQSKTAELARADGTVARLYYEQKIAQVTITDSDGKTLYDGPARKDGRFAVPKGWECSVGALMRSMHRAEKSDRKPRRPRPRVVVPPDSKVR